MERVPQPVRRPIPFSRRRLHPRGVQVVRRLQEAGFEAYFVGGCVRDLLLGQQPKDFDIATSAKPRAIQRLFQRARVIGRRFRLVHVHAGRNVFEVSTFRKAPPDALGKKAQLIKEDNIFGTAREDALRRDFTVNALFLDPRKDEIVDYADGLKDINARMLHAIGDPYRRFREDPVRVLRLIKFMRRLQLSPGEKEIAAAKELAPHLREAATPRTAEEMFRLMLTGDMQGVYLDLQALGAFQLVLPDLAKWIARSPEREARMLCRFRALDEWMAEGGVPSYGMRLALLYGPYVEAELSPQTRTLDVRDPAQVPSAVFAPLQERARLPRAVLSRAARILLSQRRMDPPSGANRRGKRWDPSRLVGLDFFPDALEYLRCRLEAEGRDLAPYDEWQEYHLAAQEAGGGDGSGNRGSEE